MLHVLHVSENDGIIITICAQVTQSFTTWHHRVLIRIHMGSMEITPKRVGYQSGGLHLGKFLTRRLSPVTTG
jgi:hypothetical protein